MRLLNETLASLRFGCRSRRIKAVAPVKTSNTVSEDADGGADGDDDPSAGSREGSLRKRKHDMRPGMPPSGLPPSAIAALANAKASGAIKRVAADKAQEEKQQGGLGPPPRPGSKDGGGNGSGAPKSARRTAADSSPLDPPSVLAGAAVASNVMKLVKGGGKVVYAIRGGRAAATGDGEPEGSESPTAAADSETVLALSAQLSGRADEVARLAGALTRRPHLRRDWAHPPPPSAPGLRSPLPTSAPRLSSPAATSAPRLDPPLASSTPRLGPPRPHRQPWCAAALERKDAELSKKAAALTAANRLAEERTVALAQRADELRVKVRRAARTHARTHAAARNGLRAKNPMRHGIPARVSRRAPSREA